jgi:serine/threonine protein kinase
MSPRLEELMLRWEEQCRTGKSVSVEELCRDDPALRNQLCAQIAALEKMDPVLDLSDDANSVPAQERRRSHFDDLAPNGEPIPGYRLVKRLGEGGTGEVWKAFGPGGFPIALMFVNLSGRLGVAELRSLDLLKDLRHPNLLSTFGAWHVGNSLVIAMELGEGTLLDRLFSAKEQRLPGIPFEELMRHMAGAAVGIDYLNTPHHRLTAK